MNEINSLSKKKYSKFTLFSFIFISICLISLIVISILINFSQEYENLKKFIKSISYYSLILIFFCFFLTIISRWYINQNRDKIKGNWMVDISFAIIFLITLLIVFFIIL